VDVKAAEEEARLKLFSGRSGAGLWAAFEQALATRKIRVQQVRAPDVPG
jgi:hypothetical protein